ncbi:MAG: lytic transglycosylase domain-containing protein [Comamonas sp.]
MGKLFAAAALAFLVIVVGDHLAPPTPHIQSAPAPVPEIELPVVPVVAQRPSNQLESPRESLQYRDTLIRTARAVWGMDAPVAVFAAQVHQESAWKPGAVSKVGAQGLAQFMPGTTTWIATLDPALSTQEPFNPAWALRALVTYDQWLYARAPVRYTNHDRMWVALRGYNGGLGHWQAEARASGVREPSREQVDAACGTARRARLHCKENLGYPHRILVELQPRYAAWGPGL